MSPSGNINSSFYDNESSEELSHDPLPLRGLRSPWFVIKKVGSNQTTECIKYQQIGSGGAAADFKNSDVNGAQTAKLVPGDATQELLGAGVWRPGKLDMPMGSKQVLG